MAKPVLLAHNVFNEIQNRDHVVTASASAVDHEPWRAANGRRHPTDYAGPPAGGVPYEIRVDMGAAKSFDFVALDRGHNLDGVNIQIEKSSDDFATAGVDVVNATIPSSVGGSLTSPNGCRTEEGAWIHRLGAPDSARYLRLLIPTPVVAPQIVGLWVGLSWAPAEYLDLPLDDDDVRVGFALNETPWGWQGASAGNASRSGSIRYRLAEGELSTARAFRDLVVARPLVPFWVLIDQATPEQALLAVLPPQVFQMQRRAGWSRRQAGFQYVELQPRLR